MVHRALVAVLFLAVCGACGRINYDPRVSRNADGGIDGSADAAPSDAAPSDAAMDGGAQMEPRFAGRFVSVTVGDAHSCALSDDGLAFCWGVDESGQLGENVDGDNELEGLPVAVDMSALPPGTRFRQISAGSDHTCGIASDGRAFCWGSDENGQLGENADGDNLDEPIPVAVDSSALTPGTHFLTISAGARHTCGVASDGRGFCWGSDLSGQLGEDADGDNLDEPVPVPVDLTALNPGAALASITTNVGTVTVGGPGGSAENHHSCALSTDGFAYCWGADGRGQLGDAAGGSDIKPIPVPVDTSALPAGVQFTQLSAGTLHTCARASNGDSYCWGRDFDGELGTGTPSIPFEEINPVLVNVSPLSGGTFVSVKAAWYGTFGVASDGTVYAWGRDGSGSLGETADGDDLDEPIPVAIDTSVFLAGESLLQLSKGPEHACGVSNLGNLYCWGLGLLSGRADAGESPAPRRLLPAAGTGTKFRQVSLGDTHSCGITTAGDAYCWGSDRFHQLGDNADGDNLDEQIPTRVDTSTLVDDERFSFLSAGFAHTCGLTNRYRAYCWSDGGEKLGGPSSTLIPRPVNTSPLSAGERFVELSAGANHSCGLTSLGRSFCWGNGNQGHLGNGTLTASSTPVEVDLTAAGGRRLVSVSARGLDSACGLASDGLAICWGRDGQGQLGEDADGNNDPEPTPVTVDQGVGTPFRLSALASGFDHTCGLADGAVYCAGRSTATGTANAQNTPVAIDFSAFSPTPAMAQVADGGHGHVCAVSGAGELFCWGRNQFGQLATGDELFAEQPQQVDASELPSGSRFLRVSAGGDHSCAINDRSELYCWGRDDSGQLGEDADGDNLNEPVPVRVSMTAD